MRTNSESDDRAHHKHLWGISTRTNQSHYGIKETSNRDLQSHHINNIAGNTSTQWICLLGDNEFKNTFLIRTQQKRYNTILHSAVSALLMISIFTEHVYHSFYSEINSNTNEVVLAPYLPAFTHPSVRHTSFSVTHSETKHHKELLIITLHFNFPKALAKVCRQFVRNNHCLS